MDTSSTNARVLGMTLLGLGAAVGVVLRRANQHLRAVFSGETAAAGSMLIPIPDATHRDSASGGSELLAQFRANGYVIVEDLFTRAEMSEWKGKIKEQLSRWPQKSVDPSTGREVAASVTGVSVWMAAGEDPSSPTACPEFFVEAFTAPRLGKVLRQLLGEDVEFLSTKPVLKTGKIRHASPWHQDFPCLRMCNPDWKGTNKVSLWVAIDDASIANGCLKVVPCSHGVVMPHEAHQEAIAFDSRVNETLIKNTIDVELASGSVLFFHDLTLHASNPNNNGADRFCMIPTYRSRLDNDPDPLGVWPAGGVLVQ